MKNFESKVKIEDWIRKDQFHFFKGLDKPTLNITQTVDAKKAFDYCKQNNIPFFHFCVYAFLRSINFVEELRYRIRSVDNVVKHSYVNCSYTVLNEQEQLNFSFVNYQNSRDEFIKNSISETNKLKVQKTMQTDNDSEYSDNVVFMTCLPWIHFTHIEHPGTLGGINESIPRVAWGKLITVGSQMNMPLAIQVHHALADGLQVAKFYEKAQFFLSNPEKL